MTYIPLAGVTHLLPPGGGGVGMHVIPVEKAISMENQTLDIEHLSYWLKKYEGHIGVGRCSCRASRAVMGEGCADDDECWCIGVGDFADYCRETGKGHDITYEEAMQILRKAEDNGFVHQITNIDGENKIFGICNCNVQICNALRTSQLFNTPNLSRSAYTAEVTKENCVACGKCVEYCPPARCASARSSATRRERPSPTPSTSCRMPSSGARSTGTRTSGTTTGKTAMTRAPRPARPPAPRT